ncbi:unnamed protein product, partial [marine sediment metagenome]
MTPGKLTMRIGLNTCMGNIAPRIALYNIGVM